MPTFKVGNVWSCLVGASGPISGRVLDACSLVYSYYISRKRLGAKGWAQAPERLERTLRFGTADRFPTGWLSKVIEVVSKEDNSSLQVINEVVRPETPLDLFDLKKPKLTLFSDQEQAVETAITKERGVLKIATGGGKTLIGEYLAYRLKVPTLYVVPNRLLLYQVYNDFVQDFGKGVVGLVGDGEFKPALITVAIVHSLWRRREEAEIRALLNSFGLLIVDECHVMGFSRVKGKAGRPRTANMWYEIAKECPAYYRFGLTATPEKEGSLNGELLKAMTGETIVDLSASELISSGRLSKPKVILHYSHCRAVPASDRTNYRRVYQQSVLENRERNSKMVEIASVYAQQGKSVLITVSRVREHGVPLQAMFPRGVARLVTGETPKPLRERILRDFSSRKFRVLIGTVFKIGFNAPHLDVLIIADAGKREIAVEQKVGRVLRLFEGKEATVVDFIDDDNSVALKHSLLRLNYYLSEDEFEIESVGFSVPEIMGRRPYLFGAKALEKGGKGCSDVKMVEGDRKRIAETPVSVHLTTFRNLRGFPPGSGKSRKPVDA